MHGAKDVSCVMSIVVNCNSITQHVPGVTAFPGVTRHSRELQADLSEAKSEANGFVRTKSVRTRFPGVTGHFRELQAIFGSYSPFSGVTDPGFGSDTIFGIWFGLLRTDSGFASDCFGLLRVVSGFASGCFGVCFGLLRVVSGFASGCFG